MLSNTITEIVLLKLWVDAELDPCRFPGVAADLVRMRLLTPLSPDRYHVSPAGLNALADALVSDFASALWSSMTTEEPTSQPAEP